MVGLYVYLRRPLPPVAAVAHCFRNLSQNEPVPLAPATGSGDNTTVFHFSTPSMNTWYKRLLWSPSMCFSIVIAPNLEFPVLMYLVMNVSKTPSS